jgi:hypothetical protein
MRTNHVSLIAAAGAFLMVTGAAGAVFAATEPSKEGRCCYRYYDYNYESEGNNFVIGALTERINAMELAIIEALRLGTGQVSGNLKEQIGADSNLANAQDDRAVVGRIEQARMDAMRAAASGNLGCQVQTYSLGGNSVGAGSIAYASDLAGALQDWATGTNGMPASTGEAVAKRIEIHCGTYANEQDIKTGFCPNAEIGELANASTDANKSLFYVAPGELATTLSPERAAAANAFLTNALNPEPLGALLPEQAASPGGQELVARHKADTARISVATDAASFMTGKRTPQAGDQMMASAKAAAAKMPDYVPGFEDGLSWHAYMDVRARGWIFNQDFLGKLNSNGYEQAIKDGVMVESFNAYMGWETYQLMERQTMILATMLAIQVEQARGER